MDPHQYGTASDPSQTERITDPARIAQLLKRIHDNRTLLSVSIPRVKAAYLTAVLKVDAAGATFELDELSPADGRLALLSAGRLTAYAQCSGVDISFTAALRASEHDADGNFYRFAFPSFVLYRQRREHYRVRIGHGHPIPIRLATDDRPPCEGTLHDISAGGLGGEFDRYRGPALALGQVLSDCELRLDEEHVLRISLEVRFVTADDRARRLRLGARFVELPRPEQKLIEHFVAALDREWRRKNQGNRAR
jgi:c-di-GMP-binding flagellar brake protein YcgR